MKKILLVVLFLPVIAFAASSGDGFNVGLSGLIYNKQLSGDNHPTATEDKNTHLNFKLGYLMSNNFYFGGIYSTLSSGDGTTTQTRTAMGAQAGYHADGYFLDFTYYLSGAHKFSDLITYKDATGIGIEVGYNTMVSSNFYVGAELNYMTLTYKKIDASGTETASNNTWTEMYPMLNAGFIF